MTRRGVGAAAAAFVVLFVPALARAEDGHAAWLRYERIADPAVRATFASLPDTVLAIGDSLVIRSARDELVRGLASMLDRRLRDGERVGTDSVNNPCSY